MGMLLECRRIRLLIIYNDELRHVQVRENLHDATLTYHYKHIENDIYKNGDLDSQQVFGI